MITNIIMGVVHLYCHSCKNVYHESYFINGCEGCPNCNNTYCVDCDYVFYYICKCGKDDCNCETREIEKCMKYHQSKLNNETEDIIKNLELLKDKINHESFIPLCNQIIPILKSYLNN